MKARLWVGFIYFVMGVVPATVLAVVFSIGDVDRAIVVAVVALAMIGFSWLLLYMHMKNRKEGGGLLYPYMAIMFYVAFALPFLLYWAGAVSRQWRQSAGIILGGMFLVEMLAIFTLYRLDKTHNWGGE